MKKLILSIFIVIGTLSVSAQSQQQSVKTKKKKDDYAIVIKNAEKDKINWKDVKTYFLDKKTNDSIQISLKISDYQVKNLKSEKKYTIKGTKSNIDKLVEDLKVMISK